MTFRDIVYSKDVDIDVCDDYADDVYEAYVGGPTPTESCELAYGELFDREVVIIAEGTICEHVLVKLNGAKNEARLHNMLGRFLAYAAGYCSEEQYAALFNEEEDDE